MLNKYANDEKELSVLVIIILNYFFHKNYEIRNSTIKLCVVAKYAHRLEHTKSLSIIGLNNDCNF